MQNQMTFQEALQILVEFTGQLQTTRQNHSLIQVALQTIEKEHDEKKASEEPKN